MPIYSIEARSFCIALAWCHNFWVLKNADSGATIAELHGLAYDRVHRKILPIGTTREHALRVFLFPHDEAYAQEVGRPPYSTRMYAKSRAHVVYRDADSLARWSAAVAAMPMLDALDLTYPPFGFNLRTPTVNSNSAYRTFGEIMDVHIYDFPRVFRPGFANCMLTSEQLATARYIASQRNRRVA
jgi:hypothetical protein